ncbi:ATP-binding protein [Arthrobacter glacialis]|uniref:ATP-binding protein n=1 Tax=Arthrobacter glacialis TaxID=1664 RepID=A0A2S3ZUZ1_ARTGL|nr:ATP-binding protein [Arthrobacter glacialis]POH73075.1 ATP-binding protein [Arthrobacter glacialis]
MIQTLGDVANDATSIDIRPEVNILGVLKYLNYKPWYALAEYVDNSIASYLAMKNLTLNIEPLAIDIVIEPHDGGFISIKDNAYGISIADFPRAFKAAEVPPDTTGLSEFGMGMKSASSWFAQEWRVRTSTLGDPLLRSVTFDLDSIVQNNTAILPIQLAPASPHAHYTIIELSKLNHVPQGRTLTKIRTHLASIYRKFLRSGDLTLKFNGEKIAFPEVEVLTARKHDEPNGPDLIWRIDDIEVELSPGKKIRGFVGIRAKGSTSEAGFALFRRGRVIQGSHDETYRPVEIFGRSTTHVYQRLFGEFEFEGFGVSHTKDVIDWMGYEDSFLASLRDELRSRDKNILEQAAKYRHKFLDIDERRKIESDSKLVASVVEKNLAHTVNSTRETPVDVGALSAMLDARPVALNSNLQPVNSTFEVRTNDDIWRVSIEAVLDDLNSEWIDIGSAVADVDPVSGELLRRLHVRISFAHPFVRRFSSPSGDSNQIVLAIGTAIGIAASLGQEANLRPKALVRLLNTVLLGSFTIQGE